MNFAATKRSRFRRNLSFEHCEPRWTMAGEIATVVTTTSAASLPDFSYIDENPASDSVGQSISPRQYLGQVSAWYFAHAGCSYCGMQFGFLDQLQAELAAQYPLLNIDILGVNEAGFQAGNPPPIVSGRELPWLQDVDANNNSHSDIWTEKWNVTFRDLVILNGANEKIAVYNLTEHNLATSANYAELRQILLDAALAVEIPYQNHAEPLNVNGDEGVGPLDALLVINELNAGGARKLPAPTGATLSIARVDVNGDGFVSPLDALLIINDMNAAANTGGEPAPQGEPPLALAAAVATDATAEYAGGLLAVDSPTTSPLQSPVEQNFAPDLWEADFASPLPGWSYSPIAQNGASSNATPASALEAAADDLFTALGLSE